MLGMSRILEGVQNYYIYHRLWYLLTLVSQVKSINHLAYSTR